MRRARGGNGKNLEGTEKAEGLYNQFYLAVEPAGHLSLIIIRIVERL